MVAWLGAGDACTYGRVHVPFWSKKPIQDVIVEPLHQYHVKLIGELLPRVADPPAQAEMQPSTPSPNDDEDDEGKWQGKGDGGGGKGKVRRGG